MDFSDPRNFRRSIAGAAMILGPLTIVLAEILHARFETDAAKQLDAIAENTGRWYVAHLLVLIALILAVPAFLGLVHVVRHGAPTLGHASLVAFVPGVIGLAALAGMELVFWQMAQSERNREEMVALAESLNESAGTLIVLLFALLFPIAWLLVGTGLYRARAVPVWAAAFIGLSQPVGFISELAGGPKAIAVAAQVVFAAGLVPVGLRVLRQTDDEWERPPVAGDTTAATA